MLTLKRFVNEKGIASCKSLTLIKNKRDKTKQETDTSRDFINAGTTINNR